MTAGQSQTTVAALWWPGWAGQAVLTVLEMSSVGAAG